MNRGIGLWIGHVGEEVRPAKYSEKQTVEIKGLKEIADKYDGILLDQFGVIHDGYSNVF